VSPRARAAAALLMAAALGACRGEAPATPGAADLARLVDSLIPAVEREAGLGFRRPPRSATRTPAEVRAFVARQIERELPERRRRGIEATYQLLGLLPDTVRLESLLAALYAEQVAGYYDPDEGVLVGVAGADAAQLRLVLAHELVHALQGQYLPLDSILREGRDADRQVAAQAVLEGQAVVVSLRVLTAGGEADVTATPEFWDTYREQLESQQEAMPVLRQAPVALRKGLIFPYLQGAEYVAWWARTHGPASPPWEGGFPRSTEQVLFPERLQRGDEPLALAFPDEPGVLHDDVLGELEARLLVEQRLRRPMLASAIPLGWAGDRVRVYESPDGPALVWVLAFDDERSRARHLPLLEAALREPPRTGYRAAVEPLEVGGRPGMRAVVAPAGWARWAAPPMAAPAGR